MGSFYGKNAVQLGLVQISLWFHQNFHYRAKKNNKVITPFLANVHVLHPLKTLEHLWFWFKMEMLLQNGLIFSSLFIVEDTQIYLHVV